MSCDKSMSFDECELAILRAAVDKIDKKAGKNKINNPEVQDIIEIVESFLKSTKRICYGGTAINNILPLEDQFYDKDVELPDYDFFSPNPLNDAKKLADIYYDRGFMEVEAKSGVHAGTFKVYVNFIPVADITYLVPELFNKLKKKTIQVNGIHYSPPNYLRMAMYLELSRPAGDVSRWEKVLKRLTLLNKHYPLRGKNCNVDDIQRLFQYGTKKSLSMKGGKKKFKAPDTYLEEEEFLSNIEEKIFFIVRNTLIDQGCIFFGAFANRLYLKDLKKFKKNKIPKIPDFDVLSEDPQASARILKERLEDAGVKKVSIKEKKGVGEIIAPHYEIAVGPESVVFIYEPLACHSYNVINLKGRNIRIATLDTMLSFYLAFIYANRPYYNENRILCMSQFLFKVQQKNRLRQKGILRRFSMECYGKQATLESMRQEKTEKFKELKNKKGTKDYEWYFLRYVPAEEDKDYNPDDEKKKNKKKKKKKTKKKTKKQNKPKKKTKKKTRKKRKKKTFLSRLGFGGR